MKRNVFGSWVLVLVLVLILATAIAGAHSDHSDDDHDHHHDHHGHHHTHDDVSHRLFVVSETGTQMIFLDILDHQIVDHGLVDFGAATTDVLVSENGRYLAFLVPDTDQVQVWSSGLFLEEHGDHYDVVAVRPTLFWEHRVGRDSQRLRSHGPDFLIGNTDDGTVSLLQSEDGIQLVLPGGGGPADFDENSVALTDPQLGLLDIFTRHPLTKRATLRLPAEPQQVIVSGNHAFVSLRDGWYKLDLTDLSSDVHGELWQAAPAVVWSHPDSGWIYALVDNAIHGFDTHAGAVELYPLDHSGVLSVDQDSHYAVAIGDSGLDLHLVDVGHGGIHSADSTGLVFEQPILAVAWAGRDIAAVTDDGVLWLVSRDGRVRDRFELPFVGDKVVAAFIADHEKHLHPHDHDHHHDHDEHHHDHDGHDHDHHHDHDGYHHDHDGHDHDHHHDHDEHHHDDDGHDHDHHHDHDEYHHDGEHGDEHHDHNHSH